MHVTQLQVAATQLYLCNKVFAQQQLCSEYKKNKKKKNSPHTLKHTNPPYEVCLVPSDCLLFFPAPAL